MAVNLWMLVGPDGQAENSLANLNHSRLFDQSLFLSLPPIDGGDDFEWLLLWAESRIFVAE
jgi:hypothetical protein